MKNPSFYQTTLWALALLLAACQPARLLATTSTLRPTPSPSHTATVLPSRTPTIIPTLTATASVDLSPAPTIIAENNNGNGPLHFVFPTQAARPISAWRPPLYDVPWAMTPNDHFFFTRPIAADEVNWPQANYRYGNPYPGLDNVFHTGIDIEAPLGTPVIATAPGKVVWAGEGLMYGAGIPEDPYGLAVAISHDFGYRGKHVETIYAHMSRVDVVVGQRVDTGTQLGLVGITGLTSGPHLHFEVRVEEVEFYTTRNPELWLAPPQGWGVLAGRITDTMGNKQRDLEVTVKSNQTGQVWIVRTYASEQMVKSDEFYRENLVLSDLPAGSYLITLRYEDTIYKQTILVNPGMVSYFNFQGINKFTTGLPPTPTPDFVLTPAKTPAKTP